MMLRLGRLRKLRLRAKSYKRTFGWLWLAFLVVPLGASHSKGQDAGNVTPDLVYEVGTDSGMRYLAQHAPALRVTLLLLECELPSGPDNRQ